MSGELYVLCVLLASGLVTAGLVDSFFELVRGKRLFFFEEPQKPFILVVVLWFLAGPLMFFRNALDGYFWQEFHPGMLAFAGGLSAIWSIYSGMLVMSLILAF